MKVDFFIVGAPKSGTTSLYHYLSEHPHVEMSSQKEPDYFSDKAIQEQGMYYGKNRINTLDDYEGLFAQKEGVIYGESSVSYLFYDNVAENIKSYNPNAKIIIMLRNPVERAFSHYLMDYRLGLVSESFEDIVKKKSNHKYANLFYQQYIQVGEYANQLKRYLNVFNRENILLIDYEDFKKDVAGVVNKTYLFLGVNDDFQPNLNKKHNTYSMPKNRIIRCIYSFVPLRNLLTSIFPKEMIKSTRNFLFKSDKKPIMPVETRHFLKKHFEKDVNELSELLNKDYTKWIK